MGPLLGRGTRALVASALFFGEREGEAERRGVAAGPDGYGATARLFVPKVRTSMRACVGSAA